MLSFDEGIIGLGLTTDSKSLQEACQVGNQPKDKGTDVDTAVPKRPVDMNTHISSQETSQHDHPRHWVETKVSDSQPSNETESLPQQRTAADAAVLRRPVDMNTYISFHSRHKHPQQCVEARKTSDSQARSLPRQVRTGPHVWTGRHGVSMLEKNVEPVYKIFYPTTPSSQQVFYLTTPTQHNKPQNSQEAVGKVPSPAAYSNTTTSSRRVIATRNMKRET